MPCARVRPVQTVTLACTLAVGGCELTEVTLATADDVIIVEIVLRAGEDVQHAYLHRTAGPSGSARVPGALVEVTDESTGRVLRYEVAHDSLCLRPRDADDGASAGSCYVARNAPGFVRAEERYSLRIEVDNRVMTGRLQVPGAFELVRPAPHAQCILPPRQSLELIWTRAAGAWIYIVEGQFRNLREVLRREGVNVPGNGPVELTGLSVSGADTTLVFPREFGLFDRFDADLHPIVLAIQDGLPAPVDVPLVFGAGDRNYVNWVRGGTFNPSGQVRVPSIQGDGTGVFGALVLLQHVISVSESQGAQQCG